MRITGWHARFVIFLLLFGSGIIMPTGHRTGFCIAAALPADRPVMDMRGRIEACWEAVLAGDAETAREKADAAQQRWESVPPMVRRVISRRHPNVEEIMENLPAEAGRLATERRRFLAGSGEVAHSAPADSVQGAAPATASPPPPATGSDSTGGVILLGAAAVPTDEALSGKARPGMVPLTVFHQADRKVVVLPAADDLDRTFVVEGNEGTVTFTDSSSSPGKLLLVNPGNRPLHLQLPSSTLVLAPLSHLSITAAGDDIHGIRVAEPASSCLLVITTEKPSTEAGQTVLVAADEPIHIIMTDPQQQKIVTTSPSSPSRLLILYPAYPMAYVVTTTPADYTEVVFVGTAYTGSVSYVTASGTAAVVEVPTATSAVYVIDSPQTVVYRNTAGSVTVAGPHGNATITHSGGGAVTTGVVNAGLHSGQTTFSGPAGNSATVSSGSAHAVKTVDGTTYGVAAGAANVQTSIGQSVSMGGAAAGSVTVNGNTTATSSTMGGIATNDTTGQWAAGTRSGSGTVTRTDGGQIESAQYSGQASLTTGSGLTATTQTQVSADDLGNGSGSVNAQADMQTSTGNDYTLQASATKGEATVSASNNASGESASMVIGDQQINNTVPSSASSRVNSPGTTAQPGTAATGRMNAEQARSARITGSPAAIQQSPFQPGQNSEGEVQTTTGSRPQTRQADTFSSGRTASSLQTQRGQQGHQPAASGQWPQKSQRTYSDEHDMFGNTGFGSSRPHGNSQAGNRSGGGKKR